MTVNGESSHVLVVDDDRRLRELLRQYLTENGFAVTTAGDAPEARRKLDSLAFDLIILDVMMPGETGLSFAEWLRGEATVPILMLSAMGETEDRIAGLEHGADDYLAKPFEPRELLLRIRTVLRRAGQTFAPEGELQFGPCRFDLQRGELFRGDERIRLTESEGRLLRVLALNAAEPVSREDLTRECRLEGGERAVDVQIARLRRKIETDPGDPRFLQTVRGTGYTLIPG
jgi:two-component system phosphate regulon response regulator OmpR